MRTKVLKFVNPNRFRQYAVMYRKSIFHKWHFVLNMKGDRAIYGKDEALAIANYIQSGQYRHAIESGKKMA